MVNWPDRPLLSARDLQVARLAATGISCAAIAGRLCLSTNTVKTHLRHVYVKLEVRNRIELEHALLELERPGSRPDRGVVRGIQVLVMGFLSYALNADLPIA